MDTRVSSSSCAGATYLDRTARIAALGEAANRAGGRLAEIRRVVLFGSLVKGIPTPRSDADLLIEVEASPWPDPRDRVAAALDALRPLPCPVDALVLTSDEIAERRGTLPLLAVALRDGVVLWERAG